MRHRRVRRAAPANLSEYVIKDKAYDVMYADPPWTYNDKANAGKRGASHQYPTMDLQAIHDLDVARIMRDDSVVFLWVTAPLLEEGIATIKAWGFKYKTIGFVWVKRNKAQGDGDFMGMGNWVRSNAELCLMGVRGKPSRMSARVRQIVRWMEEHDPICIQRPLGANSAKPPVVRKRITELMGEGTDRIELFARDAEDGWDQFGHGIQGEQFDIREVL